MSDPDASRVASPPNSVPGSTPGPFGPPPAAPGDSPPAVPGAQPPVAPGDPPPAAPGDSPPVVPGAPPPVIPGAPPSFPADDWPAVPYWAAGSGPPSPPAPLAPAAAPAPPAAPAPTWTRTYELPSARQVVSSGLQLAVATNAAIRRASIYIGLLSLGAFGPSVILILLGLGRLMSDPRTAETFNTDPSLIFLDQPEIAGPLSFIYLLVILGLILLVAISIDAQAMAISLLGGTASERPLRLRESIIRARQVFWRLAAAGSLVGLASVFVSAVVGLPFLRPFDSNAGVTFIATMIGTLAVTPFAFASAGIVLGDVGATESLRRSVMLFRARPPIALVVTLFTLVTSAIQTFAFGAGADAAIRLGEFLHLGLDQGGPSAILTGVLVLAFVVAFGSLTVTIAAIVSAPQVAGFLGMTFYSGGLDRARIPEGTAGRRFRWVTLPMLAYMIGLALLAGFGFRTIAEFEPRAASPLLTFLRAAAAGSGEVVTAFGPGAAQDDLPGDQRGVAGGDVSDIVAADAGAVFVVPDWLLDVSFDCSAATVTCAASGSDGDAFAAGAIVFIQRMAVGPDSLAHGRSGEWGPTFSVPGSPRGSSHLRDQFVGSTHAVMTRRAGAAREIVLLENRNREGFVELPTRARSVWIGADLITLVPIAELLEWPETWDVYAREWTPASPMFTYDTLRDDDGASLIDFAAVPSYATVPTFAP